MKQKTALMAAIILSLTLFTSGCVRRQPAPIPDVIKPVLAEVINESVHEKTTEISGNVKPSQSIRLGFKVSGRINTFLVEEGDPVTVGQPLVIMDPSDYELNVDATRAKYEALQQKADSAITSGVNQAAAQLEFITAQHERVKQLFEAGAATMTQLEEVETKLIVAQNTYQEALDAYAITESELRQVQRALELAEARLADTIIYSPIDGVVLRNIFEAGENIDTEKPAMVVGRLDELEVEIGVPDTLIHTIHPGAEVDVFIYGLEQHVTGTVTRINPTADLKTRTFGVQIAIDNTAGHIRPGMIARVTMAVSEAPALLVPVNCVSNTPEGSSLFVVVDGNQVEKRSVELGSIFGDRIEVLAGLKSGETVVVDGHYQINHGDKVNAEVVNHD